MFFGIANRRMRCCKTWHARHEFAVAAAVEAVVGSASSGTSDVDDERGPAIYSRPRVDGTTTSIGSPGRYDSRLATSRARPSSSRAGQPHVNVIAPTARPI